MANPEITDTRWKFARRMSIHFHFQSNLLKQSFHLEDATKSWIEDWIPWYRAKKKRLTNWKLMIKYLCFCSSPILPDSHGILVEVLFVCRLTFYEPTYPWTSHSFDSSPFHLIYIDQETFKSIAPGPFLEHFDWFQPYLVEEHRFHFSSPGNLFEKYIFLRFGSHSV